METLLLLIFTSLDMLLFADMPYDIIIRQYNDIISSLLLHRQLFMFSITIEFHHLLPTLLRISLRTFFIRQPPTAYFIRQLCTMNIMNILNWNWLIIFMLNMESQICRLWTHVFTSIRRLLNYYPQLFFMMSQHHFADYWLVTTQYFLNCYNNPQHCCYFVVYTCRWRHLYDDVTFTMQFCIVTSFLCLYIFAVICVHTHMHT